jgi:hypothetical protein
VRRQAAVTLVRCSTPYGAVLNLPEVVQRDPHQAAKHEARAMREERARAEQLAFLYDKVAELKKSGAVSKNRLRSNREGLHCAKNDVDALVDRALSAGVLTSVAADKLGRILDLGLGTRPRLVRATLGPDPRIPDDGE